jgi:carbon storage regulator
VLVIVRKARQSIFLGEEINVMVLEVGARRVKLGIEAPEQVKVMRKELLAGGEGEPSRREAGPK